MKIRTDFVTNSSSSGFVAITVNMKNGSRLTFEREYDTGDGGYFWNGGDFEDAFDLAATGEDVLNAILNKMSERRFLELDPYHFKDFKKELESIKSIKEISSIEMDESTHFDDGEDKYWELKYDVGDIVVPFVSAEAIKPSFNNYISTLGDFSTVGDRDAFLKYLKENGWHHYYDAETLIDRVERGHWMWHKWLNFSPFLIIGDITAKEIADGKITPATKYALKFVLKKQKELGFSIMTESEFVRLGAYKAPWDSCSIDSLVDKLVYSFGHFDCEDIEKHVFDCGGVNVPNGNTELYYRFTKFVEKCDYLVVGNQTVAENVFSFKKRKNGGPTIITEQAFLSATAALKGTREGIPVKPINLNSGNIMVTGMAGNAKKALVKYIEDRGGTVASSRALSKKISVVIYADYNRTVQEAELLRFDKQDIQCLTPEKFYMATESQKVLPSASKTAQEEYTEGTFEIVEIRGKGAILKKYNQGKGAAHVTIPDGVTQIGKTAFFKCDTVTGVTIPDSVVEIGERAFKYCSNLTTVEFGAGVCEIGSQAFGDCKQLKSISVPEKVTVLSYGMFAGCKGLTEVKLPETLNEIQYEAFAKCTNLSSVNIPDSVTTIGSDAFCGCSKLENVNIPNSITSIGDRAFNGCKKLANKDGYVVVKNILFGYFGGEKNAIVPDGVIGIGVKAFEGRSRLTSVTIPDSVTSIGSSAFRGCSNLTSIAIPDSVTVISDRAFGCCSCSSLTAITTPDGASRKWDDVFEGCNSLTIHASAGSCAEKYAKVNNIPFVAE